MQQPLQKEERHPWRLEEDKLIVDLVSKHGTKKWTLIAEVLREKVHKSCRNGKQCRERWHNHLDPMVRKSPWNDAEEFVFIEAHKLHGNKWAEIAKMIPGRTDNAIKNHFYSTLRKLISRIQKDEIPPEMKFDQQIRKHTTYLSKYLKNLLIQNHKTLPEDQQQESVSSLTMQNGPRNIQLSTKLMSENPQFLAPSMMMEMGTNDLYVMKKLKESGITLDRIDAFLTSVYLNVVKGDNSVLESDLQQVSHSFQPLVKQDGGTGAFSEHGLRHQPRPILGERSIVHEGLNGITNQKIRKTDIEMEDNQSAFSDQSTLGKQKQAMSSSEELPVKQETEQQSAQFVNIKQYETSQSSLTNTMADQQNLIEEEKMDKQLKYGPQNPVASSNNVIYSQKISESATRLTQKILNSEENQMNKGETNKKYSFEKEKESTEFQKFINEGDILIIDDLKNKSEQLFREYNEAKEQELDQRNRQKERSSQYQQKQTQDGELSGTSPISTLALAAAATRNNYIYSNQLSVSPSLPGQEIFPDKRHQHLLQAVISPSIQNHGLQYYQSNNMQDDSGYRMVQFTGNNPGGYGAANQQSQFQEIYQSTNQNQANRSNYYNCQVPTFSQGHNQYSSKSPQLQYGIQLQAPYHVADQNSPQQFVTINGERYLLVQPNQSSPMTPATMINIDHVQREDIEQSANTASRNEDGDHFKFQNVFQGQQFVYIPFTNTNSSGQQQQYGNYNQHQENYIQLRDNENSSLRIGQPSSLNFQIPHHQQQGIIQSPYNDGTFQISRGNQSSDNVTHINQERLQVLARQASVPVPSYSQFTHPSIQSGWRMVVNQNNSNPRPVVVRPQAQNSNAALEAHNYKLQELVQNLGKIGEKLLSEGSKPQGQIIKPQLIRNEQIIQNQLAKNDYSPQSSLQGQITMVPTQGHATMNRLQNESQPQAFRQPENVVLGNQFQQNFSQAEGETMSARTGITSFQGVIQKPLATIKTNSVNLSIRDNLATNRIERNEGLHSIMRQPLYQARVGLPQSYQNVSQPSSTNFIQSPCYQLSPNITGFTQQKKD